MKRQSFAALSAFWTGVAAADRKSATVSTQLGMAHNLHNHYEFLCFQHKRRENGDVNKARRG
jgi:hypothetical protein